MKWELASSDAEVLVGLLGPGCERIEIAGSIRRHKEEPKRPKCSRDPRELRGAPIGMYHCPECGEMVIAGMEHPDYSLLDDEGPEELKP